MLKWDETELTGFFGVIAVFHEDEHSYSFEVNRDSLRLLVTLFDLEGGVYVSIFRGRRLKIRGYPRQSVA
jgi:hypothetical protein